MMARCADSLFYKIICLSLLGIAVTFTIILTNVFVDIDNLIFAEEASTESESVKIKVQGVLLDEGNVNEQPADEDNDTDSNHNDAEVRKLTSRTRRSVADLDNDAEADSYKDSKSMSALTNKIVKLLEDMDQADSSSTIKYEKATFKPKSITTLDKNKVKENNVIATNETPVKKHNHAAENNIKTKYNRPEYDFLHLGMHNILLNGIINHADLTNVFKKVHYLIESFNNMRRKQTGPDALQQQQQREPPSIELNVTKAIKNELSLSAFKADEEHIFNELINCSKLKQDLAEAKLEKEQKKIEIDKEYTPRADAKLVIKTIIDIKDDESEENTAYFTETTEKPLEIGNEVSINKGSRALLVKLLRSRKNLHIPDIKKHDHQTRKHMPKAYLDELLSEYFNNFNDDGEKSNVIGTGTRPKREAKVLDYSTTVATVTEKFEDKDYQDLYVEIDTHFKNRALKSDKKKQIINSFIKKIETALHNKSDMKNETQQKVQVKKQVHVKKRVQYPYTKNMTKSLTVKSDNHNTKGSRRTLNPIGKTITNTDPVAQYADESGSEWSKKFAGPSIFTGSKSINSAEMHEVDVDFHQVSDVNGIPQRLQQPLQPSNSGDGETTFRDLENVRFVVNDLEGSGLSVGFNQYTDAPPDPSVINVFTGLNDLINTYQNNYTTVNDNSRESNEFGYDGNHYVDKRYTKYKDYFSNDEDEDSKEVTQNDGKQLLWNIFKRSEENEEADIFSTDDNTIISKNNVENKRMTDNLHQPRIINLGSKVKLRKYMSKRSNINEVINPRKKRELDYISDLTYPNPTSEQEHFQQFESEEMPMFKTDNETRLSETPINTNEVFHHHNTDYLLPNYPHTVVEDELKQNLMTKIPFKIKIHAKNSNNKEPIKRTEPFDNPKDHIPELDDLFSKIGLPGKNLEVSIKSSSHNDSSSTGYKETHTTINKQYKKNGVNVITLFNVSHISKVEKQNDSIVHLDNSLNTIPRMPFQNIIDILNSLSTTSQYSTPSVVTEPYITESQTTYRPTKDTETTFVSGEQTEEPTVNPNTLSGDVKISVVEDKLLDKLLNSGNYDDGPDKLVKMIVPTSPPVEIYITKEQFEKISFNWVNDKLGNTKQDTQEQDTQVTHTHETTTVPTTTTVVPTTEPEILYTTHKHGPEMLPQHVEEQLMFSSLLLNRLLVKLENNTNVMTKLLGIFKTNPDTRRRNHNPKPPHKNLHVKKRTTQHFYIAKNSSFIPYIRCIHSHNNNHTHYIKQCHVYNTKLFPNITTKLLDTKPKYSGSINTIKKNENNNNDFTKQSYY